MEGVEYMKQFFYADESSTPGKYMVRLDFSKIDVVPMKGSITVFEAHILGLHYADYLRLCRDEFGAEIIGKGHMYPIIYFPTSAAAAKLAIFLNKRLSELKGV